MKDAKHPSARTSEVVCTRLQIDGALEVVRLGAQIMNRRSVSTCSAAVAMSRAVIEAAGNAGIGRGEGSWDRSWIEDPTLERKQRSSAKRSRS